MVQESRESQEMCFRDIICRHKVSRVIPLYVKLARMLALTGSSARRIRYPTRIRLVSTNSPCFRGTVYTVDVARLEAGAAARIHETLPAARQNLERNWTFQCTQDTVLRMAKVSSTMQDQTEIQSSLCSSTVCRPFYKSRCFVPLVGG
jgi:hypothetical protein